MDMCRFSGSDDVEYLKVAAALERIGEKIANARPISHGTFDPMDLTFDSPNIFRLKYLQDRPLAIGKVC